MFNNHLPGSCGHCGNWHTGVCPKIAAIEYYPDGTIKRVEYWDEAPPTATPTKQEPNPFDFGDGFTYIIR